MSATYSELASFRMPIQGSVFSVVQISTSRPRYSASFFSILDLSVPRGLQCRLVVRPQRLLRPSHVEMVPGKMLRQGRFPPGIKVGIQPDLLEHLHPTIEVEVFIPLVEAPALPPRLHQRRRQPTVAPGEDPFDVGLPGVVGFQMDPA